MDPLHSAGLSLAAPSNNPHLFQFPPQTVISDLTGKRVNLSHIQVDLSGIFIGGIGYGGGASKLLATGMKDIGDGEGVCNLPFCMEGLLYDDYKKVGMVTAEELDIPFTNVAAQIEESIKRDVAQFHFPINLNNHASLCVLQIIEDSVCLRFYDSMTTDATFYLERYSPLLIDYIKLLLPSFLKMKENYQLIHLLSQGGPESSGCGYYTLYTAHLLKEKPEMRSLTSTDKMFFGPSDDHQIRAELVVRSLLARGLDKVNEETVLETFLFGRRNYIFDRIGRAVLPLKAALAQRMSDKAQF